VQNEAIQRVRRANRGAEDTQPPVKPGNVPKWAQRSQESIREYGAKVGDGAGKRVVKCEMCTENDKEGSGWDR
jgi:hypothetical protein